MTLIPTTYTKINLLYNNKYILYVCIAFAIYEIYVINILIVIFKFLCEWV